MVAALIRSITNAPSISTVSLHAVFSFAEATKQCKATLANKPSIS
jgi:hypothetical protein